MMKRVRVGLFLCFSMIQSLVAMDCSVDMIQLRASARDLVDIHLRVNGLSCTFFNTDNGKVQADVTVKMLVLQGGEIKSYEFYKLSSGVQDEVVDLLDKRRFLLDAGVYSIEINIVDDQDTTNVFAYKSKLEVGGSTSNMMSDAMVLKAISQSDQDMPLVHNGYYMEVLPYMLYRPEQKTLHIYQEMYGIEGDKYYKVEFIKDTSAALYNGIAQAPLYKVKKLNNDPVSPILTSYDLSFLTSGYYDIYTSILQKDKTIVAEKKVRLIVDNPMADLKAVKNYNSEVINSFVASMDSHQVIYALKALVPITPADKMSLINYVIREASFPTQQYYLLQYWSTRYSHLAKEAYDKYMTIARVVDKDYNSNVGHGFETDRGYIYLKYGKPSKYISVVDEPNTVPYEIWYYNYLEATGQTNVRFLFFDRLQANDYELLHSTCYAERRNPAWEVQLYKFNQDEKIGSTLTATEMQENWGRRAKKLFNDF